MTIALKNGTAGTGFTAVSSDCGNDYAATDGKVLLTRVPYSKRNDKTVVAAKLKKAVEKHLESLTNNEASLYEEHAVFKSSKEAKDSDYTDGGTLDIAGISKREQVTIIIKKITEYAGAEKTIGGTKKFKPAALTGANDIYDKELKTEKVLQLANTASVSAELKALVQAKAGLADIKAGDAVNGVANQNDYVLLNKDLLNDVTNTASIVVDPATALKNGGTYFLAKRTEA